MGADDTAEAVVHTEASTQNPLRFNGLHPISLAGVPLPEPSGMFGIPEASSQFMGEFGVQTKSSITVFARYLPKHLIPPPKNV